MADVYVARDLMLERTVAIKLPKPDVTDDGNGPARLRREAIALASVKSPHIVGIHDVGIGSEGMYLVMHRLHGRTIEEDVTRFGPMEVERACRIVTDILAGLTSLHDQEIVHRDLKPSNVLVDLDDRAVLLDLGVALHRRRRPLTPHGLALGTPELLSPEQLDGTELDGRTDVFHVGLLFIYVLTGNYVRVTEGPLDARLTAGVPAPVARIVWTALAPLDRRYASARDMAAAIHALVLSGGDAATSDLAPTEPVEPVEPVEPAELMPSARVQWQAWLGAMVAIALIASWFIR